MMLKEKDAPSLRNANNNNPNFILQTELHVSENRM